MIGAGVIGASSILSDYENQAISPLSKNTTYQGIFDLIRLRLEIYDNTKYPDLVLFAECNNAINSIYSSQDRLYYQMKRTLNIADTSNPHNIDLTSIIPFPYDIVTVVYHNPERREVTEVSVDEIEVMSKLPLIYSDSVFFATSGDSVELFIGDNILLMPEKSLELIIERQPLTSTTLTDYVDLIDSSVENLIEYTLNNLQKYKN